ncbi:6111_t:CDS:2, partial [Ambispora gerdemannii]
KTSLNWMKKFESTIKTKNQVVKEVKEVAEVVKKLADKESVQSHASLKQKLSLAWNRQVNRYHVLFGVGDDGDKDNIRKRIQWKSLSAREIYTSGSFICP